MVICSHDNDHTGQIFCIKLMGSQTINCKKMLSCVIQFHVRSNIALPGKEARPPTGLYVPPDHIGD